MPKSKAVSAKKSSCAAKHSVGNGDQSGGGGAADKVIFALAVLKKTKDQDQVDKATLKSLAGIAGASTMRNALARLKKEGRIEVHGDLVSITDEGYTSAGSLDHIKIPTTNKEKHDSVKSKLKPKQCLLFDKIADGHPHNKEELREEMQMAKNSTWRNLLASLVTPGYAEHEGDCFRLTRDLFPIIPRPE